MIKAQLVISGYLLLVAVPVWAIFGFWSVRTFWRTSAEPPRRRRYAGAKFMATFVTVGSAVSFPIEVPLPLPYEVAMILWAALFFPVSLPLGYFVAWVLDQADVRAAR